MDHATPMIYDIKHTEAGLQYLVNLLRTRPIAEAAELLDDIRAQAQQQEADAAAKADSELRARVKAELVAEQQAGAPRAEQGAS